MPTLDPRQPVVVAVGQHTQRTNEGAPSLTTSELHAEALRAAVLDSGSLPLGAAIDSVRMIYALSTARLRNAPAAAARLAGLRPTETVLVNGGGESPGAALAGACQSIAAGEREVIALVAGEAWFSRVRAERKGEELGPVHEPDDVAAPVEQGSSIEFVHPAERALGIVRPIQEYPLFEQAFRASHGTTLRDHQELLGRLCATFSDAAQRNPYAWDRSPHTAEEIATATHGNRYVGFPYTKLMVSNEQVDMAAAMIVTSVGRARELGIDRDRWVFPIGAASGAAFPISERWTLDDAALSREVGAEVERQSGRRCADATHVDLYSCFPSAVQIQARELGLADGRQLSATGGMRFSGGPWCGYAMHGFATIVAQLRADPGALGLVSANGGAISKLVVTLLSTTPSDGFSYASAQAAIDATPRRRCDADYVGAASIESYTVMHARDGSPEQGIVACRTPDDARTWAIVAEEAQMDAMTREDLLSHRVTIAADRFAAID